MKLGNQVASQLMLLLSYINAQEPDTTCLNDYPDLYGNNPDCFHFIYEYLTWQEATEFCATELSSELLVVQSNKHIVEELIRSKGQGDNVRNAWIAPSKLCRFNTTLDAYKYRGNGEDSEDDEIVYSHFRSHFLYDAEGDELCYLLQHQATYKNSSTLKPPCDLADFPFVCKYYRNLTKSVKNEEADRPIGIPAKNNCRSENGMELQIYPTPTDWQSAEKICMNIGGHLVMVHDDNTNYLQIMLRHFPNIKSFWIGLTQTGRASEGWTKPFRQYLIGTHDAKKPVEANCIAMTVNNNTDQRDWIISSCDTANAFVCQYRTSEKKQRVTNKSNECSPITIGIVVSGVLLIFACLYIAHRRGLVVIPILKTAFWNGKWHTLNGNKKSENEADTKDLLFCENSEILFSNTI